LKPIHTIAKADDRFLLAYDGAGTGCARVDVLRNAWRLTNADYRNAKQAVEGTPMLAAIRKKLGVDPAALNFEKISKLWDPAFDERYHNFTPALLNDAEFHDVNSWFEMGKRGFYNPASVRALSTNGLMRDVLGRVLRSANQSDSALPTRLARDPIPPHWNVNERVAHFSAHDTTVAAVLATLGSFSGENPPYASTSA